MKKLKAGCFLIDMKKRAIALVYRKKQKDFTFPKGHVEEGESLLNCAIRETEEETKRKAKIIEDFEPYVEEYKNTQGEDCCCYMFYAVDMGVSNNKSLDRHELVWCKIEDVKEKLSYQNLKDMWVEAYKNIIKIINKKID